MHDVVSLDQERLRRGGPFAGRPDAFRPKAIEHPRSSETDTALPSAVGALPDVAGFALPAPSTSVQGPLDLPGASDEPAGSAPLLQDAFIPAERSGRVAAIGLAYRASKIALSACRGAFATAQEAGLWIAPRSRTFALRCLEWLKRSRRPDELADLSEQSKYKTLRNRLNRIAVLESEEQEAVQNVSGAVRRTHQAGSDLVQQGEVTPRPMFVVAGWACRIRVLPGGSRQIVGFLLPGDGIGIRGCGEPLSITTITALTTLETVDGAPLLNMAAQPSRFPGVAHAVGRASVQDEEFFVNQIVRLASPSPTVRLAHLMLELQWRLAQAGLATEREFSMPLTYDTLSQAMGVTSSVASKAMRRLRRDRVIRFRYGHAVLARPDVLRQMSGFTAPGACTCTRMTMAPA